MLGLDAAGKTSTPHPRAHIHRLTCFRSAILYKLKLNQSVTTIPTGQSYVSVSIHLAHRTP